MQRKFDVIRKNEENFHQATREVPMKAVTAFHKPITMDVLWDSGKRGKPNKAPGEDGNNQEFFKVVWDTIKQELLEITNQM
jgi:hypothetical protein